MRVKVLFFGQLRDVAGRSEDLLELASDTPLESVFEHYALLYPKLRELRRSIVMARNHQFSIASETVSDGDEVAFLPPVSGGSSPYTQEISDAGGHFFGLTFQTIDTASLRRRMLAGTDGAICCFEGVVRNNTKGRATKFLDYQCYEPMAIRTMAQIGLEIAASHAIGRIAMVHRLGCMEIGEASVLILTTAPHRRPAFDAALEGINRLKKVVPIWKKEHFVDGEVWVDGEWDDSIVAAQSRP